MDTFIGVLIRGFHCVDDVFVVHKCFMLQYPTISMYRDSYVPYVWRHCGLLRPCRCTGRQLTAPTEEGEEEGELMLCPPNSNLSIYIDTVACALMILFYVIMYVLTKL